MMKNHNFETEKNWPKRTRNTQNPMSWPFFPNMNFERSVKLKFKATTDFRRRNGLRSYGSISFEFWPSKLFKLIFFSTFDLGRDAKIKENPKMIRLLDVWRFFEDIFNLKMQSSIRSHVGVTPLIKSQF